MKSGFPAVLLALLFQAANLSAATLVTNLSNTQTDQAQFWADNPVYQSFLVGSSDATIDGVKVAFAFLVNPTGVQVSLFSDIASAPGSSLGAFNYFGPPAGMVFNSPTFTGNFNVTANTRYWIQIAVTGGGEFDNNNVWYTSDVSETGLAGWSVADSYRQFFDRTGRSIQMEISGVPEPSAVSLVALGIGGLVALSRVRRKAN